MATQIPVQAVLQQLAITLHTQLSQAQPLQPGEVWAWHMSVQEPQSLAQFWQFSPCAG